MKLLSAIIFLTCFYLVDSSAQECKSADQELNIVYKKILTNYKDDTLFLSKLKKAQVAWIKFRDAHVGAHFPLTNDETAMDKYGSVYSQCECNDLEMLTRERIKHLQMWLDGYSEGEVCPGSVKNLIP